MKPTIKRKTDRIIKSIKRFIDKTFFPSTQMAKQTTRTYLQNVSVLHNFEIYSIKVRKALFRNEYTITFKIGRPGIFIGKGGKVIDGLKESLLKRLIADKVNIKIVEYSIWNGTFDEQAWEKMCADDQYSYDYEEDKH